MNHKLSPLFSVRGGFLFPLAALGIFPNNFADLPDVQTLSSGA